MTGLAGQDVLTPLRGAERADRRTGARHGLVRTLVRGCVAGAVLVLLLEAFSVVLGANFHPVVPGQCYRSAQVSAATLEALIRYYHIRTVVNLRGDNVGDDWYEAERTTTRRLGVKMVDVGLWAYHAPLAEELRRLVDALAAARLPVLVHCHQGGDRAGLAAACYLLLRTDATLDEARQQLGLRYGHNALGQAGCHDDLLDRYGRWLRGREAGHSPYLFRAWVYLQYDQNMIEDGVGSRDKGG